MENMQNPTFLEELYYGNIRPNEKFYEKNSEYAEQTKIIVENECRLISLLNSLQNNEVCLLSELMNAQSEILAYSEFERFIEGFRLGANFMLETFIIPQKSVMKDINFMTTT